MIAQARNVPDFLRSRDRWVVWESTSRKMPIRLAAVRQWIESSETGRGTRPQNLYGNVNDLANHTNFETAQSYAQWLADKTRKTYGVGFALTGDDQVIAFDFDHVLNDDGTLIDQRIEQLLRDLHTWAEVSPSGTGLHAWCVVSPSLKRHMLDRIGAWTPFTAKGGGGEKHSVYVNGGYVTVTGRAFKPYTKLSMDCDEFVGKWFELRFRDVVVKRDKARTDDNDIDDGGVREQVLDALDAIDADCDRDTWVKVGMVLHKLTQGDARGEQLWDKWSRRAPHRYPKSNEQQTRAIYRSFGTTAHPVSLGTLLHLAKEWRNTDAKHEVTRAKERLQRTLLSAKDQLRELAAARGVILPRQVIKEGALFVPASSLNVEATRWLWTNTIPFGHVVLVSGAVGAGKSSVMLKLAADASHAKPLPYDNERKPYQARVDRVLGASNPLAMPYKCSGVVYYLTSEMHWSQTAVPTLRACGANLDNIYFMRQTGIRTKNGNIRSRPFDLVGDLDKLIRNIIDTKVIPDMIMLDPITSFLGQSIDRNTEADVRSVLELMADFCALIGTAFVGVLHQNKSDSQGVGKMLGSVAFGAVARVVLFLVPCKSAADENANQWENGTKRVGLLVEKSNIGPDDEVHVFKIAPSEQLGVEVTHTDALSRSDFMRENNETSQKGDGPSSRPDDKALEVEKVLASMCASDMTFSSARKLCDAVSKNVGCSLRYVYTVCNRLYSIVNKDDGVALVLRSTTAH